MAKTERNGQARKQALKEALLETLQEQREFFREIVTEALEDLALAEAIRQGRKSKPASRGEVLQILQGKP